MSISVSDFNIIATFSNFKLRIGKLWLKLIIIVSNFYRLTSMNVFVSSTSYFNTLLLNYDI